MGDYCMEMIKSLSEIRKEKEDLAKAINMLETLIERAESKKTNPRQVELFIKSLEDKKEKLRELELQEKKILDAREEYIKRGIIKDSEPTQMGEE